MRCVGYPNPSYDGDKDKRRWVQRFFPLTETALRQAQLWESQGLNVYYAPALFKSHDDRKFIKRTQENTLYAAAFWCDLDVRPDEPGKYANYEDPVRDVDQFCTKYGLPNPTYVWSGAGLHCYWLLSRFMWTGEWGFAARKLKGLLAKEGVKADPVPTANIASWLRPVGIRNVKRNAVVTVLREGQMCDPAVFTALPDPTTSNTSVPNSGVSAAAGAEMEWGTGFSKQQIEPIIAKCEQMRHVHELRGNVSEPHWYATIGVLAFVENAESVAHEFSDGHPNYSAVETDRKREQYIKSGAGPTRCDRFDTINPGVCVRCPLYKKISSPILAGQDKPVAETIGNHLITSYGVLRKSAEAADGTAGPPKKILNVPLRITAIGQVDVSDTRATLSWVTPTGTAVSAELPLRTLSDGRDLDKWLLSHNITGYTSAPEVYMFLKDYANTLNSRSDPEAIPNRFGWWSENAFVLGTRFIKGDSTTTVRLDKGINNVMRSRMIPKGDASVWSAATKMFDKPSYGIHAFPILASFAAPLFELMKRNGVVLSLAGLSNAGKTTLARYSLSIWCDPDTFLLSPTGTNNAKNMVFATAKNLPVIVDDISGPLMKTIQGLIFTAANGVAKESLTKDRELRDQQTWRTVVMVTTNNSIMDLSAEYVTDAEKRRTLELMFTESLASRDADTLNAVALDNHGVVGEAFIRYVINNRAQVIQQCDTAIEAVRSQPGIDSANRFGIWLTALSLVAGKIAHKLGLIQFNPRYAIEAAVRALTQNGSVQAPEATIGEEVSAYVKEYWGKIARKVTRDVIQNQDVIERGSIMGALRLYDKTVAIPTHDLHKWLSNKGIDSSVRQAWVKALNIRTTVGSLIPDSPKVRYYVIPYDADPNSNNPAI